VLSLIRSQPKQAETALEDMADLFRVLMADNRDLVPLAQEIALCRQYLSIEKLRLEERLNVNWHVEQMPPDALIPPLILQPLLENAVYHGIEPLVDGGDINIFITSKNHELIITISNPYISEKEHHNGNKMALKNIKERLLLHYDLEASLKYKVQNGQYEVQIRIPNKA
jgi:two-component system sensor histidine kinase AlgZ